MIPIATPFMNVLILVGSFHRQSRSLAIAASLEPLLTPHRCTTPRLETLPFFSEDLNHDRPAVVQAFLEQVAQSDALVVVTPEYNHSIPAVLKNAIDWASRPAFHSPLKNKPVTFITQAESPVGGARAQAHLKLVFDSTLSILHPAHEMMITGVSKIFGPDRAVADTQVLQRLDRHLKDFLAFVAH